MSSSCTQYLTRPFKYAHMITSIIFQTAMFLGSSRQDAGSDMWPSTKLGAWGPWCGFWKRGPQALLVVHRLWHRQIGAHTPLSLGHSPQKHPFRTGRGSLWGFGSGSRARFLLMLGGLVGTQAGCWGVVKCTSKVAFAWIWGRKLAGWHHAVEWVAGWHGRSVAHSCEIMFFQCALAQKGKCCFRQRKSAQESPNCSVWDGARGGVAYEGRLSNWWLAHKAYNLRCVESLQPHFICLLLHTLWGLYGH